MEARVSPGEHRAAEGCNTPDVETDFWRTQSPEGASGILRDAGGNAERVSLGDEPSRVLREGKALKGRNPMSGSGMK